MTLYPRRLIEVDLPIKRISAHARREKSIRHGHISTLHMWWARRPLAACRAVLCAVLWPDPVDVTDDDIRKAAAEGRDLQLNVCPPTFRNQARVLMGQWATEHLNLVSAESYRSRLAPPGQPRPRTNYDGQSPPTPPGNRPILDRRSPGCTPAPHPS